MRNLFSGERRKQRELNRLAKVERAAAVAALAETQRAEAEQLSEANQKLMLEMTEVVRESSPELRVINNMVTRDGNRWTSEERELSSGSDGHRTHAWIELQKTHQLMKPSRAPYNKLDPELRYIQVFIEQIDTDGVSAGKRFFCSADGGTDVTMYDFDTSDNPVSVLPGDENWQALEQTIESYRVSPAATNVTLRPELVTY